MKDFNYVNANTVDEAVSMLKTCNGKAKVISGGTDLLGILKDKILPNYPETIINLKSIQGLNYLKEDETGLKIGALAKLDDIVQTPIVRDRYKIIGDAAEAVATPQIRNLATIAGNLCQDIRCWYYRYPHLIGGRILCHMKGGKGCYALTGENNYHSVFGASRVATSPPCSSICPGSVDIPSYLSKIREGALHKAAVMLMEANPMPSITGRVCPHFCEQECNRNEFDETVSIKGLERFMGDYILDHGKEIIKPPETDTGKRVAIVGSGPAGLSAAFYLRRSGHHVAVFDRMGEAGGMLTYGIPAYRLPKDIVRRIVKAFQNMGIDFRLKVDMGKDVTMENLKQDFDAVFLATGAWASPSIGLQGEEYTKLGLEFLANLNLGHQDLPGKSIVVIGGGNVAVDVSISALRLGAEEVTLACLESKEEMPAFEQEAAQALEEGVKLMPSWGPYRVLESNGKVSGIELVRCVSVYDKKGLFAPRFDPAEKMKVEADQIILAVGQTADLSFVDPKGPLNVNRGLIAVDQETQGTNLPSVFAGGDVTTGPATVIEAIAAGKRAAKAMNFYLRRESGHSGADGERAAESLLKFSSEHLKKTSRAKMPILPVYERTVEGEDVEGLGLEEVKTEASRCFNCGCVAVCGSDMAVALAALDAKVKLAGPGGHRTLPITEFFKVMGTVLEPDEIITEIQVPRPSKGERTIFLKFRLRDSIDFAVVSVASVITVVKGTCKKARIVLGAVAPVPVRVNAAEEFIKDKVLTEELAKQAAAIAVENVNPLSMNAYKVQIAENLVKQSIMAVS